jgi:photosystem II stability/assembly factor-like uncharacterized protein
MQEVLAMRFSARGFFLLPLILLTAAAPALAAPVWKALGPFGGTIQTITAAPSDTRVVYVTTQYEGAFRSTDGGASWVPIHKAFVTGNVAADPARPGTVYLATPEDKLVKSTDYGSHWTLANRGLEGTGVSAVAVDPARPSRVYAALDSRVFRSTNGGASWQPSRQAFPSSSYTSKVTVLLPVPRPRGTVFAVADGKLWKSGDAGDTWKALDRDLSGYVFALAASPLDPWTLYASVEMPEGRGGVFRSRDSGASWEAVRETPSLVISLAVSPRSSRTVWAGTMDKGLLVSQDGGAHWKAAGLQGMRVMAVAIPSSSPRTVFAATVAWKGDPGGVFASEDGGATWERRNRGLAGLSTPAVLTDPATPGVLWAHLQEQGGLFRSTNGGRDWTSLPIPATYLAMAPSMPSTLYAVGLSQAWRTEDGGASWVPIMDPGNPAWWHRDLWVDPLSPTTLWSNGNGFARSVDGGATWVHQPLPGGGWVTRLAFAPSSPSTVYAAGFRVYDGRFTRTTAWRSTDGGATWTSIENGLGSSEPTALAIDPVDPRLVYVTVCGYYCSPDGGIWKSADGGEHWTLTGQGLEPFEVTALAASPIAGVVWAAVADGRIFRSADSGETWRESTGPQARVVYQLTLDPQDPRRVYAATSSGVWRMEDKSEDEP